MISASELSAWNYCPRQIYFKRILGIKPERKEAMVKGTIKHEIFERLVHSFKKTGSFDIEELIANALSKYAKDFEEFGTDVNSFRKELKWSFEVLEKKIKAGHFPIPKFCEEWLESVDMEMKARVDAIFDQSGEWIVGDLKTSASDFLGTRLQIGAGALLFEKHTNVRVNKIKIISHFDWAEKEIHLTSELRNQIMQTRDDIHEMLENRKMPPISENPNKCKKCEFWESHCNPKKNSKNGSKTPFWKRMFH
jgi:CRISPR/Cas system-associated exonuclease Cas4 (RecB family)